MKTRTARYLFVFFSLALLAACLSSPLRQKILIEEVPQYQGAVSPISIPIKPEYKPGKGRFRVSAINQIPEEKMEEFSGSGTWVITRMRDFLLWEVKIWTLSSGDSDLSSDIPVTDMRFLTDSYGNVKEVEYSMPSLERLTKRFRSKGVNIDPPNLKDEVESLKNFAWACFLSDKEVRTGDTIMWSKIETPKELDGIEELKGKLVDYTLRGWSYHEGRKVLVTDIDTVLNVKVKAFVPNSDLQMSYRGYALINPDTFQMIDCQLLTRITMMDKTSVYQAKSYVTMTMEAD